MAYEGSITITDLMDGAPGADGSSVSKATILYWLKTDSTNPSQIPERTQAWSDATGLPNRWTKIIPSYIANGIYYVCLESEITDNKSNKKYVYGAPVVDNGLTDAATNSSEAVAISRATRQHFWFVSEKTGTIDAGAYITDTPVDTFKQGKTGGYLYASSTGLTLGKDNNTLMALSGSELAFYRPGTSTIDAKLNSNGLMLTKGGIKAGTVNSSGFVYLSTDNYGSNVTINSHQASNWKQIIGTKFGVDADGNLYASGANIQGQVTITAGSNVYTKDEVDDAVGDATAELISAKEASGSIVHVEDASEYPALDCKVALDPVQDLHGYDKPWAGGNGKNLLKVTASSATVNNITYTVNGDGTIKGTGSSTNYYNPFVAGSFTMNAGQSYILNGCPTGGSGNTYRVYTQVNGTNYYDDGNGVALPAQNQDISVNVLVVCYGNASAPMTHNELFKPMIRLASESDPTWEPYSNICPISGWDSVKVTRTGKNLLSTNYGITTRNGVAYTPQSDGSIRLDGTTNGTYYCYVKTATEAFTLPQGTYTFTCWKDGTKGTGGLSGRIRVDIGSTAGTTYYMSNGVVTIDIPSDAIVWIFLQAERGVNATGTYRILVERSSTSSDEWESYQGDTYTIDLDGTRYSGTLDVTRGVLSSSDKASITITAEGQLSGFSTSASGAYAFLNETTGLAKIDNANVVCMCSSAISTSFNNRVSDTYKNENRVYGDERGNIIVRASAGGASTKTELFNLFKGSQIVYELATPITVQLTPTEVELLAGENNVWADSGDTYLKYVTMNSDMLSLMDKSNADLSRAKAEIKVTTDGISSEVAKKIGNSEVISKINQSAETVKIQASKVEIDGTATFNAIKAQTDAAYDAKGAANTVQTNLDNLEIGGRNYVRDSEAFNGWSCAPDSGGTAEINDGILHVITKGGYSRANGWFSIKYSELISKPTTFSVEVKANSTLAKKNIVVQLFQTNKPYRSVSSGNIPEGKRVILGANYATGLDDVNENTWTRVSWTVPDVKALIDAYNGSVYEYFALYLGARLNANGEAYFRKPKFEYGTKATDWIPAPEDVQAEIDAKKSVHTIDTNYSYSYANILTYSAEGYSGNWAVASTSGVKIGDTVRLKVTVSDMSNAPVYVIGTVTAINNRTELKMTSHGLDTTIIDGGNILTNSIGANQIKANAIDTSKLTVGAKDEMLNSKIEVGGRNILRGTANPTPRGSLWKDFGWYTSGSGNGTIEWGVRLPSSPISEITNGLKLTVSKANADFGPAQGGVPLRKGTVTLSVWVKGTAGDKVRIRPVWADPNGSVPEGMTLVNYTIPDSDWHRYEATQVINYDHEAGTTTSGPNNAYANAGYVYVQSSTVGRVFYMAGIKLEYGNKATDWTASPDDYVDDADNMLLDWDVPSLTMVKAKSNRYWSTASSTWITPSFQSLLEPPEEGIKYLQRYVVSTANSSAGERCLAFYGAEDFTTLPLKLNTPYTVSFWARKTSGSGKARVLVNYGGDKIFDLTSDWKRYTFTFTITTKPSNYYRVWIGSYFPANTTGTVEVCGCKLVAGIDGDEAAKTATSYITNIGNDGIRVHPASTGNNSVLINSDGMTVYKGGTADTDSVAFYGDTARIGKKASRHVEIKTGGMQVYNGASDSELVTHIGYESVQGESGPVMGAFFTFGTRKPNQAKGEWSVAEGYGTTASGFCSHAEGNNTTASDYYSHAEGVNTTASSYQSHAEGRNTTASGYSSHAEGHGTTASGVYSHAEGCETTASSYHSHAEGRGTTASGTCSHAGGGYTHASRNYQTVIGKYNKILSGSGTMDSPYVSTDAAFVIGGGTARTTSDSKDIFSVDWDGNVELAIDSSATGSSTVDGKIMDSLRSLGWDASTEGVIV